MRVAFLLHERSDWTGGLNYLRNLLLAVETGVAPGVTPVLFAAPGLADATRRDFGSLAPTGVISLEPEAFRKGERAAYAHGCDHHLAHAFARAGVDVVFQSSEWFGAGFPFRTLVWLPDFQHRYLPGFFTVRGWVRREAAFQVRTHFASRIMVSSAAAEQDCLRSYPHTRDRVSVVRFAVPAPRYLPDAAELRDRYTLPERFVYLPNQLWQHKNHALVLDALERPESADAVVVATGNPSDVRTPDFPAALLASVERRGLAGRFRFLGLVPYSDVLGLMRLACAVINPSRFEGWSTTVEEAKTMAVPLLLSDLTVHREQAPGASFFGADDVDSCARLLGTSTRLPTHHALDVDDARARQEAFARAFEAAVRATL